MQNLKYKIGLCNVFWNKNGIDTKYFNNVEAQKNYFLEKINGGANLSPLVNFNINDNITTVVTYQDNSERTIEELIACNYAIILKYNTDTNEIINTRYFFAKASQLSGRQMRVELDLDDLQTNYFRYRNNIAPCVINRAHLNRFIDNGDNTISFDFRPESHLFTSENNTTQKRLIKRDYLNETIFNVDGTKNIEVMEWFKNNIIGWVYCYVENRNYQCYKPDEWDRATITTTTLKPEINYFYNNQIENEQGIQTVGCIIYPLYKENSKKININHVLQNHIWEMVGNDDKFRELNNDASFYYIKKISIKNPFQYVLNSNNYRFDEYGNLVIDAYQLGNNLIVQREQGVAGASQGFICLSAGVSIMLYGARNYSKPSEMDYNLNNIKFTFNKSEIIGELRNKKFNPKLLNEDFISLNLTSSDGTTFEYPINALNNNNLTILYNETLNSEITKYYARVKETGIYIKETENNYTGLIGNVDNSIVYTNDKYQEFIANNKNFWLQASFNSLSSIGKGIVAGAISGGGIPGAIIGGTLGAVENIANKSINLDNLKNSPDQLKSASGSILFNADINKIGVYIEIYECLEHNKQQADDYFYKNGFEYGEIGNITDFDNIRTIFNYISAEVEGINANISDEEKTRLIEKLKAVRFWNIDGFDYVNENYERSIANG